MLRARSAALVAALLAALAFAAAASASHYVPTGKRATSVSGSQSVLIVRATWGPEPFATATVNRAFSHADAFVRRSSFGRVRLRGDVTGWLNVLTAPVGCPAEWWNGIPRSVTDPANAAAGAGGYRFSSYDRVIYLVPASGCMFGGFALEPAVFLNGLITPSLLVHELGHTYGLSHARGASVWPVPVYDEYGDIYSPMGEGFTDFSVYEKTILGWIRNANVARADRSGTYTIGRADVRTGLPFGLRIDTATREYWFEYRPKPLRWRKRSIPGGVLARVVDPTDVFWPLSPYGALILNPNGRGRPTLGLGERLQVPGEFSVRVAKVSTRQVVLRVSLAGSAR